MWGSNINVVGAEGIEIDYGAGITPKWWGIDFNFAALGYTYPGGSDLDYLELRASAAHTFNKLTLSIGNWWSPDNFQAGTQSDAVEFGATYAFAGKLFNFFSPSISGAVGEQFYENDNLGGDYTYWNAGLTLGFLDHGLPTFATTIRTIVRQTALLTLVREIAAMHVVGALKATF